MNELLTLVTLGILVEAIVEVLKSVYQDGKVNKVVVLSLIIGIIIAFTMDIDMFELLGHEPQIQYVGIVATGIIGSRGANFVHDFIEKLQ